MAVLVLGALVFLVVAVTLAAIALWRGGRAWRVAEAAALMARLNVVCFCAVLMTHIYVFMWTGWDVLDWAVLLCLALFVVGCQRLRRIQ